MEDSIKNQVQQQFAKNAGKYVTSIRHAKGEDLSLLVSSSKADTNMDVLDIATGGGHVANALAPLVRRVTAYDLTEEMLKTAAEFIRGNGHSNVDFVKGDAEQLPFVDASFDLVTCRIAAHHFPNIPAFAEGAFRVVKPGGKLLLIDNVGPEDDRFDQFYNEIEKQRDPSHVRAWKKSEWINLLENVGFRIEMIVCFPKPFQFHDWCERSGLPEEETALLQTKMLQASKELQDFFSIRTDESGGLSSFSGEAVYLQAIRPS
ncbi:methyltransferase domain-containing protein [Paenibacillus sp. LMG 31456]|uniref:Methyltransferase domain-containing protein n=1 Tax=Paenibacillus foliorum TaxID=2654974 RepID=A0A972K2S1_9BACL|nr:class I SAM-dependent methyltransferase [Paenibacillus foliorum]NOU98049.1 methyltransferase domain-containing protein [Paenibacillus foliorum]